MTRSSEPFDESIRNPHDAAFKAAFGDPELARAFFRDYLPAEMLRHLDLRHLKPLNRSFVDKAMKDRHADLAYETRLKDRIAFLYLLFEHQSSPDPWMAFRLLQYMIALWLDFRKEHPKAKKLPGIVPMVLYHGKRPWNAPIQFRETVDAPADIAGFLPDFTYRLFDLGALPDDLSAFGEEVRVRVRLYLFRHIWDDNFWERFGEATDLLARGEESILMDYLRWALRYGLNGRDDDPETARRMIERETQRIGNETIRRMAMNTAEKIREEGRTIGKTEGRLDLLETLMVAKFGSFPDQLKRRISHTSESSINRFATDIFELRTLREVEKWWDDIEGDA